MSYSIVPVQSRLVKDVWWQVRGIVDKGLVRDDRYQSEDMLVALLKKQMQLWVIQKDKQTIAVVITEITIYPRVKECTIVLLAGEDFLGWGNYALTVIGQWAYEAGCKRGRMFGRLGWDKVLNNEWKREQIVMTVDLQEISHEWQQQRRRYNNNAS